MKLSRAFAKVVKNMIRRAGLTIRGLSRRSGVPERTLQNIVGGHQAVSLDQAKQVADGLDVSTSEIVGEAEAEMEDGKS